MSFLRLCIVMVFLSYMHYVPQSVGCMSGSSEGEMATSSVEGAVLAQLPASTAAQANNIASFQNLLTVCAKVISCQLTTTMSCIIHV